MSIDAEVAVELFGWEWFRVERHLVKEGRVYYRALRAPDPPFAKFDAAKMDEPVWEGYGNIPPRYSTDIAAAFLVVKKMREMGYEAYIWWMPARFEPGKCHCRFVGPGNDGKEPRQGIADTMPEAISLAALSAIQQREGKGEQV